MKPEPCPSDWQEIALALYNQLRQECGQWVVVRVQETLWEVVRPRSQEAILAACETTSQSDEALVLDLILSCERETARDEGRREGIEEGWREGYCAGAYRTETLPPSGNEINAAWAARQERRALAEKQP